MKHADLLDDLQHGGGQEYYAEPEPPRRRKGLVIGLCSLLFLGAGGAGYAVLEPMVTHVAGTGDFEGPGNGETQVTIPESASGQKIAQILAEAGVVKSAEAFSTAAAASGKASKIQPGVYKLPKEIPADKAVSLLLNKANKINTVVQVIEGRRANEIADIIAKAAGISAEDVKQVYKDPALQLPPEANGNVEGFLYPDTYQFDPGVTPLEMVQKMVDRYNQQAVALKLPADPAQRREIMIRASLIQAEGGDPDTMHKISRVILNRLAKPMLLQFDSTTAYAEGIRRVDTTDAMRQKSNDWNTYKLQGLPKTPIDSPGKMAIDAAVNPSPGPWLYFVAVNTCTGETKFAETMDEHAKYTAQWKAWAAAGNTCEKKNP